MGSYDIPALVLSRIYNLNQRRNQQPDTYLVVLGSLVDLPISCFQQWRHFIFQHMHTFRDLSRKNIIAGKFYQQNMDTNNR